MARIVLAMSGGVDSSVAAHRLTSAGHDVIGVFLRHGESSPAVCDLESASRGGPVASGLGSGRTSLPIIQTARPHRQGCCSARDADDARTVADRYEIPFYALDMSDEFGAIMDYFVDEYAQGRTPNPCVMCNTWIKFGRLFDYADSVGAEFVATGHYARTGTDDAGRPVLRRGLDAGKDQSYALFGIDRRDLGRMMLPIGEFTKAEIRQLAASQGLLVADKPDSQEICFVTTGHHGDFVRRRLDRIGSGPTTGQFVTPDGQTLGPHQGIENYTVGQRKGLGLALGEPVYVVRIEPQTRQVVVGPLTALDRDRLTARQVNWLIDPPTGATACSVKIRYNGVDQPATVIPTGDDQVEVVFDQPRQGVAPGQAAVFYDGDRMLGGGWIV